MYIEKIHKKLSQRDPYYYRPQKPETKYDKIRKGQELDIFGDPGFLGQKLSSVSRALKSGHLPHDSQNSREMLEQRMLEKEKRIKVPRSTSNQMHIEDQEALGHLVEGSGDATEV